MPEYRYRFGERFFEVSLARLANGDQRAIIHDGESQTIIDFTASQVNGEWRLHTAEGQFRGITSGKGDERDVWLNGHTYLFRREQERAQPTQRHANASGQIEAQMPGLVRDVLVQVGDVVERGQTLAILEAMKMEMRATAPFAGVVRQVRVSKSDIVTRGQVLIEIAPSPAPDI